MLQSVPTAPCIWSWCANLTRKKKIIQTYTSTNFEILFTWVLVLFRERIFFPMLWKLHCRVCLIKIKPCPQTSSENLFRAMLFIDLKRYEVKIWPKYDLILLHTISHWQNQALKLHLTINHTSAWLITKQSPPPPNVQLYQKLIPYNRLKISNQDISDIELLQTRELIWK